MNPDRFEFVNKMNVDTELMDYFNLGSNYIMICEEWFHVQNYIECDR
jgi:hypothetical protein